MSSSFSERASGGTAKRSEGKPTSALGLLFRYVVEHYGRVLFWLVFIVPTISALIFWGAIASDRYVSETRFIVRSVEKPGVTGATALLQDFGINRTNDDAFAIEDYIKSRDIMFSLMRRTDLREVYRRPEGDAITRYWYSGASDTDEAFYRYFVRQITLTRDSEKGITTVKVSAYRASDAKAIADAIVKLSEDRVNTLNARARKDAVALANGRMRDAAQGLVAANVELTQYRNQSELVDPAETAGQTQGRTSDLDQQLAMLNVQLQGMLSKAPNNPAIPAVRQRIASIQVQVASQKAELTGGNEALANKLGGYEERVVKRELAEKVFEEAQKQLNAASQDASRQQIYIETIARPHLPDDPAEPRRLRYIFTVALLSFWAFLIVYLLVSGSREHLNLN